TEAEVGAVAPVAEVVPALAAGTRPVRHLVARVARAREPVLGRLEERGDRLRVRLVELAEREPARQRRLLVGLEEVRRQMVGPEGDRPVEVFPPGPDVLAR